MPYEPELQEKIDRLRAAFAPFWEEVDVVRGSEVSSVHSVLQIKEDKDRSYVVFFPARDIRVGDVIIRKRTGAEWEVVEVVPQVIDGATFSLTVYYQRIPK